MRRAVISDIHSNLIALEAVLADIKTKEVDDIVCLGDIIGYGPNPVECIDLVRESCTWSLLGHIEFALSSSPEIPLISGLEKLKRFDKSLLQPRLFSSLKTRRRWNWLSELQPKRIESSFIYVHASPRDPLYEPLLPSDFEERNGERTSLATSVFSAFNSVCFFGTSHIPGVIPENQNWILPRDLTDCAFQIPPKTKVLLNPGSVGQPRDRDVRSSYLILDTDENTVRFHRVAYDLDHAINLFKACKYVNERFWLRLQQGI